jgi:hypothetical protein
VGVGGRRAASRSSATGTEGQLDKAPQLAVLVTLRVQAPGRALPQRSACRTQPRPRGCKARLVRHQLAAHAHAATAVPPAAAAAAAGAHLSRKRLRPVPGSCRPSSKVDSASDHLIGRVGVGGFWGVVCSWWRCKRWRLEGAADIASALGASRFDANACWRVQHPPARAAAAAAQCGRLGCRPGWSRCRCWAPSDRWPLRAAAHRSPPLLLAQLDAQVDRLPGRLGPLLVGRTAGRCAHRHQLPLVLHIGALASRPGQGESRPERARPARSCGGCG